MTMTNRVGRNGTVQSIVSRITPLLGDVCMVKLGEYGLSLVKSRSGERKDTIF